MKELSIEEKAKRYDEAIKVLHKYYGTNIMFSQSLKEEMFPKLKEDKEERIRKSLLRWVQSNSYTSIAGIPINDVIAWLEKQGEKKLTDNFEPKFKVGDKIKFIGKPTYPAREIIAIKDDAYYFDKFMYLPFSKQDTWELVEQKSAWSEEDEEMIDSIIYYIKPMPIFFEKTEGESGKEYTRKFIEKATTYLEALKERLRYFGKKY